MQSVAVNYSLSDTFGSTIYFAGDGTFDLLSDYINRWYTCTMCWCLVYVKVENLGCYYLMTFYLMTKVNII